jgi:preprotein translocase subunit SecD
MLVILGIQINFTLTLAGIAGFIVAVGITADSFVVFFERIKDEVHEGRTARVGVPRAWVRARRTIISADTVSLLAAVILYFFAAGDVRGFAFTLGMSTVLDLVVVFLFTHPLVSLVSRSAAFGSARLTGLNALRAPSPAYAGGGGFDYDAPEENAPDNDSPKRNVTGNDDVLGDDVLDNEPAEPVVNVKKSAKPATESAKPAPARPRKAPVAAASTAAERAAARRGLATSEDKPTSSVDSDEENS